MWWEPNGANLGGPPNAVECMLYFCVNTYEAKMTGGTLEEETIDSWPPSFTFDQEALQSGITLGTVPTNTTIDDCRTRDLTTNTTIHLSGQDYFIDYNTWCLSSDRAQALYKLKIA